MSSKTTTTKRPKASAARTKPAARPAAAPSKPVITPLGIALANARMVLTTRGSGDAHDLVFRLANAPPSTALHFEAAAALATLSAEQASAAWNAHATRRPDVVRASRAAALELSKAAADLLAALG